MKHNAFRAALGVAAVIAVALAASAFFEDAAYSQVRPQGAGSQTFTPQGRLTGPITAVGPYPGATQPGQGYVVNGDDTMTLTISGALSGIQAVVQGSAAAPSSSTPWANPITLPVDQVGGARVSAISALGTYRINVAGLSIVRLNVSTLTSPLNVNYTMVAGLGAHTLVVVPDIVPTYSAPLSGTAIASSPTDFLVITPTAAAPTIRIRHVDCSGSANVAGVANIAGIIRTTADTGGTSTSIAPTSYDPSVNLASSALVSAFTVNPATLGTTSGVAAVSVAASVPVSTTADAAQPLFSWDFGIRPEEQPLILRGTGASFALNGTGVSFPSGTTLRCNVKWTEQ